MTIAVEKKGGLGTVTLCRPDVSNALSFEMRVELIAIFEDLASDPSVRTVLLEAQGKNFCAGADVSRMEDRGVAVARQRMRQSHRMILNLCNCEKPVVAAVSGACVGLGWSLALACDFVVVSRTARFSQIFNKVGLAPDGGALWFLSRQIGNAKARELALTTRFVDAEEAKQLGLVYDVVETEELEQKSRELALRMAAGPTLAQGLTKRLAIEAMSPNLSEFLEAELMVQPQLTASADHAEGKRAFKEKRQPSFSGN